MYTLLAGHTHLGIHPEQVVAVYESINAPNISIPELGTEPCQAYVVGIRLPSTAFTVAVYLHLQSTNRSCVYAPQPFEVAFEHYSTLEAQALQFVESMGFMLDNLHFRTLPPAQVDQLTRSLPFFFEIPPRRGPKEAEPPAHIVRDAENGLDAMFGGSGLPSAFENRYTPEESAALARFLASF